MTYPCGRRNQGILGNSRGPRRLISKHAETTWWSNEAGRNPIEPYGEGITLPFMSIRSTTMTAADDHTDLPSPTQRDSAASAIFNLYGYSSRNSSHSQGTFGAFQQGNGVAENGYGRSKSEVPAEEDGAGLVEELRSPRLEDFIDQPNSNPGTAPHDALNRISGSDIYPTPTEPMHALGPPIGYSPSTNGRQPLDLPDEYRTSSINRPISNTDQQGLSCSSAKESSARNRRRSSAASAVSATRIISPSVDPPRTELLNQQVELSASHLDMSRDNNNEVDSVARRQPGEEEDAYHVRSTCEYITAVHLCSRELKGMAR
jgi:hypothetical protein